MTTVLERPTPAPPSPPHGRRVVRVLAVREGRFILRHPLFLLGVAGSIAMIWITTPWWQAPVLHRDDARLAGDLLPLAAATLIVCNLAAFRARRHSTEEMEDTTPTSRTRRTAAHLAAFMVPIVTALVIAGGYVGFLYALGGIWAPSLSELATGPAIVAVAAAAGVALARWIPSPLAGPLGILGFAAWQIRGGGYRGPGYTNWFVPFVDAGNENHIPEVTSRPAGWHLVYLLGVAAIFAVVATLRHGGRPRRFAVLAAALAMTVVGAVMQFRPVPASTLLERLAALTDPARQTCETRETVTYCAYPAYRQWIDRWDKTVRRVLEPVPPEQRPRLTIRQALAQDDLLWLGYSQGEHVIGNPDAAAFTERLGDLRQTDDITLRLSWGRGRDAIGASLDLALPVARRAIGVTERPVVEERRYVAEDLEQFRVWADAAAAQTGQPSPIKDEFEIPALGARYRFESVCSTSGQAREAIGIWLALRAVPGSVPWLVETFPQRVGHSAGHLRRLADNATMHGALTWHGATFLWWTIDIPFTAGGIRTAFDMMERPQNSLTRAIAENYRTWVSPRTTLEALRRTFDLPSGATSVDREPPMNVPPLCR